MKRLALILSLLTVAGCSRVPKIEGELDGLAKLSTQAERNGARRCAPRELALANAHVSFARVELAQGSILGAEQHLAIAGDNVRAAYELSPPHRCAERGFEDAPTPDDCDGDGIIDGFDKCKCEAELFNGFQDEDGCPDDPDTDGDGLADSVDTCVLLAEDADQYLDADGCPDADNDYDGVLDIQDHDSEGKTCALDPEDPDGFEDLDGCPDLDNDQDTVVDIDDACPMEPGAATDTPPGCPKKALAIVTDKEIKITQQIHFDFNKAVIRPESFPVLDAVVDLLRKYPKIRLEIQGHTDNKGAPQYNKTLSDKRARSVLEYVTKNGIDGSRLTSAGYGMERPIVPNNSNTNRALNRRVQFVRTEGTP